MPADLKRYHPKWSLIKRLILRRAGHRCESCGVANLVRGWWVDDNNDGGRFWTVAEWVEAYRPIPERKPWLVKLAVAHLDHDIRNNRFWNLRALCQVCHLTHDKVDNADRKRYGPHGRHRGQIRIEFSVSITKIIDVP